MKNTIKVLAIIALVAVIGFSFAACDDGSDTDDNPGIGGTYFFASGDETYVLIISDDGTYVLTAVSEGKTSTGTAKKDGGVYKLTPSYSEGEGEADADPFTVAVNPTGVTGMTGTITFKDGTEQEAPAEVTVVAPEKVPEEYRWSIWRDPSSTATLEDYSVEEDTFTITTGGTPEPQGVNNKWQAWKISAEYKYTSKANTSYAYVIEAWKEGEGDRSVNVQYYEDNATEIYLGESITLSNTPEQYTIYGHKLPKQGVPVHFQCADYTGTFHLKIISIEEYTPGELTITNFRGASGLLSNKWIMGDASLYVDDEDEWVDIEFDGFNIPKSGNSITVPVYNRVWIQESEYDGYYERTTPFTGSGMVQAGFLRINQWGGDNNPPDLFHLNKEAITFTNGKATIDFGQQMMYEKDFDWEEGGEEGSSGGDNPPQTPTPGGSNPEWPTELHPKGGMQASQWGKTSYPNPQNIGFYHASDGDGRKTAYMYFEPGGDQRGYDLTKIEGKTLTVTTGVGPSGQTTTYILCTNWTIEDNNLTLSGGDALFSAIMNTPLKYNNY